jgi:urea transport system ATP-binding protein
VPELTGLAEVAETRAANSCHGQAQWPEPGMLIAQDPKVLLLGEPTEGIQPDIVEEIEALILRLDKKIGITMILVE